MKSLAVLCVLGTLLIPVANPQESPRTPLRKGVSVQMAVASHVVEMRAADESDATVVAVTADGKVYAGTELTQPRTLSNLNAETVYVKADSRAPFQIVLSVLDALHGKSVVLLAASPANVDKAKPVPPYGIKVVIPR